MSYLNALAQFELAYGNHDQAGMILALREVSKFTLEPTLTSPPILSIDQCSWNYFIVENDAYSKSV